MQVDGFKANIQQLESTKDAEMTSLRASRRDVNRELGEKTRQCNKLSRDAEEGKELFSHQLTTIERKLGDETALYRYVCVWVSLNILPIHFSHSY